MSPRAACRLEALGFLEVFDYAAGIADWKAAGLEVEGTETSDLIIADATRSDIPVASPTETIGAVRSRADEAGWEEAVVVDCNGVVVGRVRGDGWNGEADVPVGDAMELGPTTVRPDGDLAQLVARMEKRGTQLVIVTDPQGRLIGAMRVTDGQALVAGEPRERVWRDCDGCWGRPAAPST